MEQILMESTKKHKEEIPILRLCFVVFQGKNDQHQISDSHD